MANIISIGTALPLHVHKQSDILHFMQQAYHLDETNKRKLAFVYAHSGIEKRYSVIEDFGNQNEDWQFIPKEANTAFPTLDERLKIFRHHSLLLSVQAIEDCINDIILPAEITHLITVSCTGMSAPGLDLEIMEAMELRTDLFRTSVNFMGCYAAIHALKLANMICKTEENANVIIVATELCTLHFQKDFTIDNATSSMLFGDGSAAVLVSGKIKKSNSLTLKAFYSQVAFNGKNDMSWEMTTTGFLMTLSSYIPDLIKKDITNLVTHALQNAQLSKEDITHWCIHPGGRKILDVIQQQMTLTHNDMQYSSKVLSQFGNMSSPTILFVLKEILEKVNDEAAKVFGVAFGPGLTMETFIAEKA